MTELVIDTSVPSTTIHAVCESIHDDHLMAHVYKGSPRVNVQFGGWGSQEFKSVDDLQNFIDEIYSQWWELNGEEY